MHFKSCSTKQRWIQLHRQFHIYIWMKMSSISNSIQNALCILLLSQRTAVSHAGRFSWTSATLFVLTLANPLKWQECSERLKFSVLCSACWNKMFWCCQNIFPSLFFLKTLVEFVTSVNVPTFICKASLFWPLNCCCSLVHDMSNKRIRIERKNITFKGKKMRDNILLSWTEQKQEEVCSWIPQDWSCPPISYCMLESKWVFTTASAGCFWASCPWYCFLPDLGSSDTSPSGDLGCAGKTGHSVPVICL